MKWYLAAALILIAALVLQSGLLAYAMYVLFAVLLISRFLARQWLQNLAAQRLCPHHEAEIGDKVEVTVHVRNAGWFGVPWVVLEDMLSATAISPRSPRLRAKGKRLAVRAIRTRGETELRYTIECLMRGYYQVGPLVMETGDLFGLHRRFRVGADPHFLLVYPRTVLLQGYDIMSRRPIGDVRMTHRLYEDPTRVSGVRPYEAGDPLNRVHWRATARTGALHSKVFEPSSLSGATVVLDFHAAGYPERGEPVRSELAATAALSMAHAVFSLGQQVGFLSNATDAAERIRLEGWQGDHRTRQAAHDSAQIKEREERLQPIQVPTRRGVEQFQAIREALARAEITHELTFAELLLRSAGRVPRDATLIAVLPEVPIESALALGALRRQGFAITVLLVMLDSGALERGYGRLVSEGIRDVRHIKNEVELGAVCTREVLHGPIPADGLSPFEDVPAAGEGWAGQRVYDWRSSEEA